MDKLIKNLMIAVVILLLGVVGYQVYQTMLISSLTIIPAQNKRILERTEMIHEIESNLRIRSLDRDVLLDLSEKIDVLRKELNEVVKLRQSEKHFSK